MWVELKNSVNHWLVKGDDYDIATNVSDISITQYGTLMNW